MKKFKITYPDPKTGEIKSVVKEFYEFYSEEFLAIEYARILSEGGWWEVEEIKMKKYLFEEKILEVQSFDGGVDKIILSKKQYASGNICIIAKISDTGEPYGVLTKNIPEYNCSLADDEVFIKNYFENEYLANAARESGFFFDTKKKLKIDHVEFEIWKIL